MKCNIDLYSTSNDFGNIVIANKYTYTNDFDVENVVEKNEIEEVLDFLGQQKFPISNKISEFTSNDKNKNQISEYFISLRRLCNEWGSLKSGYLTEKSLTDDYTLEDLVNLISYNHKIFSTYESVIMANNAYENFNNQSNKLLNSLYLHASLDYFYDLDTKNKNLLEKFILKVLKNSNFKLQDRSEINIIFQNIRILKIMDEFNNESYSIDIFRKGTNNNLSPNLKFVFGRFIISKKTLSDGCITRVFKNNFENINFLDNDELSIKNVNCLKNTEQIMLNFQEQELVSKYFAAFIHSTIANGIISYNLLSFVITFPIYLLGFTTTFFISYFILYIIILNL